MRIFNGELITIDPQWAASLAEIGIQAGTWQDFQQGDLVSGSAAGRVYRVAIADRGTIYVKLEKIPQKLTVVLPMRVGMLRKTS